jgi:hypothetical protein
MLPALTEAALVRSHSPLKAMLLDRVLGPVRCVQPGWATLHVVQRLHQVAGWYVCTRNPRVGVFISS